MPDPDDDDPSNLFGMPCEKPDPFPSGHDDYTSEVMLKDSSGKLRFPAYILMALVIALAAVYLLTAAMLVAPR